MTVCDLDTGKPGELILGLFMFLKEFLKIIFFGSGAGFRRVLDFIV